MSTSEHLPAGLPDAAELQRLANALFQAPPGGGAGLPLGPFGDPRLQPQGPASLDDHGLGGTSVRSLSNPQSRLADPHGVALPETGSPVPATPLPGTPPASVAGSGVSPSATAFAASPAPHLPQGSPAELDPGRFPQSWPAHGQPGQSYGAAPSAAPGAVAAQGDSLPYADAQPFERELQQVLSAHATDRFAAQLPRSGADATGFYFLDQRRPGLGAGPLAPGHLPSTQLGASQLPGFGAGHTPQVQGLARPPFDVELVRRDFPVLRERVNGRPLVWLDNAATTQKPQSVIDRVSYFYAHENSNIHRAAHELAARATDAYEGAREKVRAFINARSVNEVIFTRGTTESINLVAQSWGRTHIQEGDEIIVSHLEHHANIVPWHRLAAEKGAKLKVIPVNDDGELLLDEYAKLITPRTKLVAFTQVSNALGTVTPAARVIEIARSAGVTVLLDGAQSVSHMRVDLQALQPDFFVFSGHKVFGPTGIGVLYGREDLLNSLPPWQGGGNMIQDVTFERIQYHDAPNRFEAGTGNIADAVGLGAAIDYVTRLGIDAIDQYEHGLLVYATRLLKDVPGLRLVGTAAHKASVLSFTLQGYKTEEVGAALNEVGIAVRSGHHCAQPILRRMGVETTVRPSLAFYNTTAEVDLLVGTLHKLQSAQRRVY
ncbi:MAG: Cysteine desulfurase [Paracidovorax wautersii]|uniref:cysteine desulfurase n=1 Tax=Paracidovorax wautersii TaxID=1177982 RepID=A0A7V8JS32_9BURK|nr:MAG: Cysteine desulfurase [Paracidovorax wautersii]